MSNHRFGKQRNLESDIKDLFADLRREQKIYTKV